MKQQNNYFFELGCEEIPARFVTNLSQQLKTSFEGCLEKSRIKYSSINVFSTYRRLAILVEDISDSQEDATQLIKGPPENMVYDSTGNFSKASLGFCKKNNIDPATCEIHEVNGKKHLCVKNFLKGKSTKNILEELVPDIVKSIHLNIAMRWSDRKDVFIRPIQWIVSLYNNEIIKLDLFGVKASNFSYAHRFLSSGENSLGKQFEVSANLPIIDQYIKYNVMISPENRKTHILKQLQNFAQEKVDDELLDEVVNLVEMPSVLKGNFDKKYLNLPEFVLIECMKKHQRYFPFYSHEALDASFLVVADNVTHSNQETIIKGNQNVLIARLEDAMFFYNNDLKEDISNFVSKLDGVVFQKKAGTMLDKQDRIFELLAFFNSQKITDVDMSILKKISGYSKFDLVSNMVLEFPALQAKMGAVYLSSKGEDDEIVKAVRDQYLPLGYSSKLPETYLGSLLAIADRFDSLVVSFKCGANPTGSQDPLGLRRAVMGISELILATKLNVNIVDVIKFCLKEKSTDFKLLEKIKEFMYLRINSIFKEKNIDHDIVESVKELIFSDLCKALNNAKNLQNYKQANIMVLKKISETAVRISRLSKSIEFNDINENLFEKEIEHSLYTHYLKLANNDLVDPESLEAFSEECIDYFEQILVMSDDEKVKENRLNFLKACDLLYKKQADFEKLSL